VGYIYNFHVTAQSKQSPIERKIAQSDHPAPQLGISSKALHINAHRRMSRSCIALFPLDDTFLLQILNCIAIMKP
jgi:hypothetical protein